jgi:hypothetical protein
MRSQKLVAVLGVLLIGMTACGSSDDTAENRRWARTFCTTLDTWQDENTEASAALQQYLQTPGLDTTATKARLTEYLDEASDSARRLIRALRRAGPPAIDAERRAVRTLDEGTEAVLDAIGDARTAVEALPVDDGAAFQAGVETANARLGEGFESLGAALERINRLDTDGKLEEAERSVKACRPLL